MWHKHYELSVSKLSRRIISSPSDIFDNIYNVTLTSFISAWLLIWVLPSSIGSSEIGPDGWDSFFWLSHQEKYFNLKQTSPLASWLLTISLFLPTNAMRVTSKGVPIRAQDLIF